MFWEGFGFGAFAGAFIGACLGAIAVAFLVVGKKGD